MITVTFLRNRNKQNCLAQIDAIHKNITKQKTPATSQNKNTRKTYTTAAKTYMYAHSKIPHY